MDPIAELTQIAQEVRVCTQCSLHQTRKMSVPGEGPANAQVLFIGEGPGHNENEQGRPFVGAAGKFLDELLGKAGLQRRHVFICNVVKCRPPNNRDPEPQEIFACGKYLDRQIAAINPKVIVTLGRFSMNKFFPNARISQIHGNASRVDGRLVVAMYHPAAALHQPNLRPELEKDFAGLAKLLHPDTSAIDRQDGAIAVPEQPTELRPVEKATLSPFSFTEGRDPQKPTSSQEDDSIEPKQLNLF